MDLLTRSFDAVPDLTVTPYRERVVIKTSDDGVPLTISGNLYGWLRPSFQCRFDHVGHCLAIHKANFWIGSSKTRSPLIRFEYEYESRTAPHSHIQIHAESGVLSSLLTRARHTTPHDLSKLHLPTGGSRFRPNLEDVIQFLIEECRLDHRDTWRAAVNDHRAEWRRVQTRAVARAMPAEAARALRELGYKVTPPATGDPEPKPKALTAW
ncbi:hypothetical protein [Nocardioides panacihumi]|uniref:hypothetical protein n=1 Tax=Nocardioides panacihumi TaxID=400774 RepID=UPI0031D67582